MASFNPGFATFALSLEPVTVEFEIGFTVTHYTHLFKVDPLFPRTLALL